MALTKEHRENISKALKGKTTWNKGKTYSLGGKVKIICAKCGKEKDIRKSHVTEKNYCSRECYWSDMKGQKFYNRRGKNHHAWKEKPKQVAIHEWVVRRRGKARTHKCEECGKQAHDWANIDHKYERNLDEYIPLCRSCHLKFDNKHNNRNYYGKK